MQGFRDKFIIETVESGGHITVDDEPRETHTPILERVYTDQNALLRVDREKPRDTVKKIKSADALIAQFRHMSGILAAAPQVNGDAIASYGTKTLSISVLGVDPEEQLRVTTIGTDMQEGSFQRLHSTADGVIIGSGIAETLGCKLDDKISLASSEGGRMTSRVVGIFETGVTPVDYSRMYMLLSSAQTLLDKENIVNEIVIRTDDYTKAQQYAAQIESIAGYKTESWQESNANFLKIFAMQTIITYIITGALLVVAAFGVLNILIMSVLERVNDIAILKSFGLSRGDITMIYLVQGIVIGLLGATLGEILGKVTIETLRRIPLHVVGLIKSDGLLMSESQSLYISAFVSALIVVLLAAVYPARRAAGYAPVEVIRGAH
jgi:lipoprotein-releasing system permease protein